MPIKISFQFIDEDIWQEFDQVRGEVVLEGQLGMEKIDLSQLLQGIQHSLSVLDQVDTDSKFDAFLNYFTGSHAKHILVLCNYAATGSYLYSSLDEILLNIYQVNRSSSFEDNEMAVKHFQNEGGVMISSPGILTGVDYTLDEVIFYDLLNNQTSIGHILGRLFRGSTSLEALGYNYCKKGDHIPGYIESNLFRRKASPTI